MKVPKIIYAVLAYYDVKLKAVSDSVEARDKVAAVSSPTFSNTCYDVVKASKNAYAIETEIARMNAIYQLLAMGVCQEDVFYLVDRNREMDFMRVLAQL